MSCRNDDARKSSVKLLEAEGVISLFHLWPLFPFSLRFARVPAVSCSFSIAAFHVALPLLPASAACWDIDFNRLATMTLTDARRLLIGSASARTFLAAPMRGQMLR